MEITRRGMLRAALLACTVMVAPGLARGGLSVTALNGFGSGATSTALSFVLDGTAQDNASSATQTYTMTSSIAVGSDIVVCAASASGGAGQGLSSVSDSRGNTYAVNDSLADGARTMVGIAMAPCTVGLIAGDTITITWTNSNFGHACAVGAIINPKAAASTDADVGTGTNGTGTSASSGTTTALAQANEIVFGVAGSTDTSTGTQDATYTTIANLLFKASARLFMAGYKVVAATTAVSYAPTLPVGTNWVSIVRTYKGL